jgi:hypothetical protein
MKTFKSVKDCPYVSTRGLPDPLFFFPIDNSHSPPDLHLPPPPPHSIHTSAPKAGRRLS